MTQLYSVFREDANGKDSLLFIASAPVVARVLGMKNLKIVTDRIRMECENGFCKIHFNGKPLEWTNAEFVMVAKHRG